jgi:hypothetical protein
MRGAGNDKVEAQDRMSERKTKEVMTGQEEKAQDSRKRMEKAMCE